MKYTIPAKLFFGVLALTFVYLTYLLINVAI